MVNVLFAGGLCPAPPVRVGRGFHPVAGDRQDSHVCRGPGRSPQRRDPARTHRPGGGTSWLSEVVVRVPHPLPRGEGARGLGPVLVDGAESHFAHFGVEEFLSDTIIHLRLREVDVGMSTSVRRYLGVVKMRGVEHDLDYYPLLVERGVFEIVSE